ncbi:MAG: hypothetical protein ACXW1O_07500 [Halobacteriota archaeon]
MNLYSLHVFTVAHGLRLCFGHLVLVRAPSSPQCDPLLSLFDKEERYTGHTDVEIVNGRAGVVAMVLPGAGHVFRSVRMVVTKKT